jgi:diguanylate cyclase (GGDEF)-like protein
MPVGKIDALERIITSRDLSPVFQPVFEFSAPAIAGYEALIRGPSDSELHSPIALFETAKKFNLIPALEYVCRDISCEYFARNKLPGKLFLNVSPMSFVDNNHENGVTTQIIKKHGISADRIVIELSEQYPMDDYEIIQLATDHYRKMGFEIAIDDLGAGYAGLRIWSEIRPDYVKIDRHFIENINDNSVKREFVRSIHDISRGLGCKVIAEGIETVEELDVLRSIGIMHGQGYLLGRPYNMPGQSIPNYLLEHTRSLTYSSGFQRSETVEAMMDHTYPLSPETTLGETAELFKKTPSLVSLPVVWQERPVGIITRNKVMELFLGQYGRDLYAKKRISEFMESAVVVEHTSLIQEVSRLITGNNNLDIGMDFIVVQNGKFLGTGKVRNLLQRITEMQIRSARYANPLTFLPGNVPIYEWIDGLIGKETEFNLAYCDINNFKPYNDKYGYSCGDEVIVKLGEVLQLNVDPKVDFVGHIGGDDFVVVFCSQDWKARCERILDGFQRCAVKFYQSEDQTAGGIYSVDRRGDKQFFPIVSLAIGVVSPDLTRCFSHHDVASLAADAKHQAKLEGGNALFVSRRRGKSDQQTIKS